MLKETLLMKLPDFNDKWEMVEKKQSVKDIRKQIFLSHEEYDEQYDAIASDFLGKSDEETFKNIFDFIKENIKYKEEPEEVQIIKSPVAILETGVCDCKGIASFIGGVLDSLNRDGMEIDWRYVFAGYGDTNHVFVEAISNNRDFWIDPVLDTFDQRTPEPITIRKFYRDMALYKLSGTPKRQQSVGAGTQGLQSCLMPIESIDQQLARIMKCSPDGGQSVLVPGNNGNEVYDIPYQGELDQIAPIDATPIDPGDPVTMHPAPAGSGGFTPAEVTPPPPPEEQSAGVGDWLKKNPLLAAAIVGGFILVIAKKKKGRR